MFLPIMWLKIFEIFFLFRITRLTLEPETGGDQAQLPDEQGQGRNLRSSRGRAQAGQDGTDGGNVQR